MRLIKGAAKNIRHSIISFLVGLFVFCPSIAAGEVNGLKEIYDTPIPAEIRRNFNNYIHMLNTSLKLERGKETIDGEKFRDIYAKKFLVIGLTPNSFGGVWATIAVEGQTRRVFSLWLYNTEAGTYDLRSISGIPGNFDGQFMERLHSQAYSKFWL